MGFTVTASAVNPGDLCYLKGNSNDWNRATADATATSDSMLGVSLGNDDVLIRGFVQIPLSGSFSADHGQPIYISTNAGSGSYYKPTGTGDVVRIIGYKIGNNDNTVYFNPDNTYLELA